MIRHHVQKSAKDAKRYYATPDYYAEGGAHQNEFGGKGAKLLGIAGPAEKVAFERLCDNLHPQTAEQLTVRTRSDRTVGYDFTFSVPKSVSLLYGLTGDDQILDAFRSAVDDTMGEMEAEMKTRVRRKGEDKNRTTGNLVWERTFGDASTSLASAVTGTGGSALLATSMFPVPNPGPIPSWRSAWDGSGMECGPPQALLPARVTTATLGSLGNWLVVGWHHHHQSGADLVIQRLDDPCAGLFADDFETGDLSRWSTTIPAGRLIAGVVTSFDRYSGTISTRPPMAMTMTIQTPSQWTLRSTVSWLNLGESLMPAPGWRYRGRGRVRWRFSSSCKP